MVRAINRVSLLLHVHNDARNTRKLADKPSSITEEYSRWSRVCNPSLDIPTCERNIRDVFDHSLNDSVVGKK